MYVGQICNRDAITITARAHVLAAAQLMREQHVGYLVVVEPDEAGSIRRPVGVLTDRDIVVGIVARGEDPRVATVRDVMSPDPVTVATTASVSAAAQEMRRMGVRRLPVVGTLGELQGVLSLDDVFDAVTVELRDLAGAIRNEQKFESELFPAARQT
jgi:CBS domain-containing protein